MFMTQLHVLNKSQGSAAAFWQISYAMKDAERIGLHANAVRGATILLAGSTVKIHTPCASQQPVEVFVGSFFPLDLDLDLESWPTSAMSQVFGPEIRTDMNLSDLRFRAVCHPHRFIIFQEL